MYVYGHTVLTVERHTIQWNTSDPVVCLWHKVVTFILWFVHISWIWSISYKRTHRGAVSAVFVAELLNDDTKYLPCAGWRQVLIKQKTFTEVSSYEWNLHDTAVLLRVWNKVSWNVPQTSYVVFRFILQDIVDLKTAFVDSSMTLMANTAGLLVLAQLRPRILVRVTTTPHCLLTVISRLSSRKHYLKLLP